VCKAGVSKENIIPLFIRGSEEDPRTKNPLPDGVPNRPQGRRPEPQAENLGMNGANFNMQYGGLTISAGFGFFPSLFGLQFQNIPISASSSNTAPNTDEAQNLQLSRILIVLGIVVIMALLFF
jgi:E3 ubiquitin-protein ligase RNF5